MLGKTPLESCDVRLNQTKKRGLMLIIFMTTLILVGFISVGLLLKQNTEYKDRYEALLKDRVQENQTTNYDGYFYTLLQYDTYSNWASPSLNPINLTISYEQYFKYKFNYTHPSHDYPDPSVVLDVLEGFCIVDEYINALATEIKTSQVNNSNQEEIANSLLTLVQDRGAEKASIQYIPDVEDRARYPIETLVESVGDCEDMAILYATLLKSLGFSVCLVITTEHALVAVNLILPPSHNLLAPAKYSFTEAGKVYYFAECTGYGWRVGDLPSEIQGDTFYVRVL